MSVLRGTCRPQPRPAGGPSASSRSTAGARPPASSSPRPAGLRHCPSSSRTGRLVTIISAKLPKGCAARTSRKESDAS